MAPPPKKEVLPNPVKTRDLGVQGLIERGGAGAGKHKNKQNFERGHARAPKHKGRGYEEGMTELAKTASSGDSLAHYLRSWWSALEDQLIASALLLGGDCSVKTISTTFLRARISLPDPFNENRLMDDAEEPHIQLLLELKGQPGFLKASFFVSNQGAIVKKKTYTLEVMGMGAEELADRLFDAATDLFESTEF